jgi:hypothetical protein
MADVVKTAKDLRKTLNPAIKGPKTDALLESLAYPVSNLVNNVQAVNDQLYIITAEDRYLDQLLAARGLRRPESLGLSDDIFRQLGIEIGSRKQIRSLLNNLLAIVFGDDYVKANIDSTFPEPYNLEDGDTLIISFDDQEPITVVFRSEQFANIGNASAQEVADAITKEIRRLGVSGAGTIFEESTGNIVRLISQTSGPSSSVAVLGGKAQNKLQFPNVVPISGATSTEWTVTKSPNGSIKFTWVGGPNPNIGYLNVGDYTNIYGSAFDPSNRGTFTITGVYPNVVGESYFEIDNPIAVDQTAFQQGANDAILFFKASRKTLNSKIAFASVFQTEAKTLELFIPATTKVVRRDNIGATYLQEDIPSPEGIFGSYLWDETKGFLIGGEECKTTQVVDGNVDGLISVDDASDIPDDQGYLVFGWGTTNEEGPVPYIGRPSSNSLMINPTYSFKKIHPSGTDVAYVEQNTPYIVSSDGSSYPFYLTDEVSGRLYAVELVELVKATGIKLVITILYANDLGYGKGGTEYSEISKIFGPDPE